MAAMDALMMGREAAAVGRMSMAEEAAFIAGGEGGMGRQCAEIGKSSAMQGFDFAAPRIGPTSAHPRQCKVEFRSFFVLITK